MGTQDSDLDEEEENEEERYVSGYHPPPAGDERSKPNADNCRDAKKRSRDEEARQDAGVPAAMEVLPQAARVAVGVVVPRAEAERIVGARICHKSDENGV
jgi:hypothetical protein